MNSQPKKIRSINKFIPNVNSKSHTRNQSINIPLSTPTQSKRPFNKESLNEKSQSPNNQGSVSARGSKNLNLKASNSNFGNALRNEDNNKSLVLDGNNSFRYNSGLKKFENPSPVFDKNSSNKKSNPNINLLGTIKIKPNTGQRISTNKSRSKIGFNLNSSLTQTSFNNTMTNLNKGNTNRSVTPRNLSKGASKDFLNRSLNMKNPNSSFSGSFLNKTGGFSKSPSSNKDIGYGMKNNLGKVPNDKSMERTSSANKDAFFNKSFDKTKEGFNPKSTVKILNKSPVISSRSNIKKPNQALGNGVSINTNTSPIYKNNKNIMGKSPIDNSIIKQFNDVKNKNASPTIYSSFIKKIQKTNSVGSNTANNKKIPLPNSNQNPFTNNNNVGNNWNNINSNKNNPIEKKSLNVNMNSNDLSTNNTNGLNSNNQHFNIGNIKVSGNTIQSNENDYIYQIQPKYEDENKPSIANKQNIYNNNLIKSNNVQNNNNNLKNRENKFVNSNIQNVDFKTMNTSPLLRKKNDVKKPNAEDENNQNHNKSGNQNPFNNINQKQNNNQSPFNIIQQNNINNQFNISQNIINPNINFQNNLNINNNIINNVTPMGDFNQGNVPGMNTIHVGNYNKNSNIENIIRSNNKTIKNIHEFTKVGFSGHGVKKVNQDNFFVFRNFNNSPQNIFMSVCDGHGMLGHEVSGYLRENLPVTLNNTLKSKNRNVNTNNINNILTDVFVETNNKLLSGEIVDTTFSGSTCVSLIYTPEKLISANVGDSRAVLGKFKNGEWKSHDLTRDHKPNDPDEAERIKRRGGRIEPFRDEDDQFIGPARVWLKDDDVPGLAMSRSFGDRVAASVGVIAEPEIIEYKFSEEDKFFIVASDGVWEFIESQECVEIIKDYYLKNDIVGCCEFIHRESSNRWTREEEVIDDITMIVVFLD